jgi:hypothetical protein
MIFTSTPCGLNHFFHYVDGGKNGVNGFSVLEVPWTAVPGRDLKWKEDILGTINHDLQKFEVEYNCAFEGSSGTLISGAVLKSLKAQMPVQIMTGYGFSIYEEVIPGHRYFCIVDVSRGKGLDYSAFHIIDTTNVPYKQVAVFRNNMITPTDYAAFIYRACKMYADAFVLVEINDIGGQIPDLLSYDYEYENIIFTESHGRSGKRVSGGFGGNVDKGIRTTKTVKAVGCSMLKLLIEQKKLEVVDKHTIAELNTFSQKGKSYEAEPGHHDDLVMGLVLFAWLSQDAFFVEMNDDNILQHLRDRSDQDMLDDLVSFGFRFDAADDYTEPTVVKMGGEWWETSGI